MTPRRVAGHALRNEGAPFGDDGQMLATMVVNSRGQGRAKCTCGALSEVLQSGLARRAWHRDVHKPEVAK